MVKIGIIGGSGLDNPEILMDAKDIEVKTPYGQPTSSLKAGKIKGVEVVLIARHGREHTVPPTFVNNRANIHALKEQGCTHIIATTACGSLREEIGRGDFVILDQLIDFTRHRHVTYHQKFNPHQAVHTGMAEPFNDYLRKKLIKSCKDLKFNHHPRGTVITIEGPRFSTKAESKMFRLWGGDVINMSTAPEAILANEAGIPYAAVAMSTDYDCWKEDEAPVTWGEILKTFKENVSKVISLLTTAIQQISEGEKRKEEGVGGEEEIEGEGERLLTTDKKDSLKHAHQEEGYIEIKAGFNLKSTIRTIPHWPKPGIMFRDITTLLQNPEAFAYCINTFKEHYQNKNIQKIAGVESRGFIFGAALAHELNLPFVLIRKKGKLPGETVRYEYKLEYGTDTIEMHKDSVTAGDNILIVDDLLATGGTLLAACNLIEILGGEVAGCAVVIDLPDLKGKEKLARYDVFSLVEFEGE